MRTEKSHVIKHSSTSTRTRSEIRIAIVGGGFTGTTTILNLIRLVLNSVRRPESRHRRSKIFWYDVGNRFGRGLPYARQADDDSQAFILNQPAYAQSPF